MKRKEFTRQLIEEYISILELQTPKSSKDYYILKNFSIYIDPETSEKKLVKANDSSRIHYVATEQIDTYIDVAHRRTLHGGVKKTYAALKKDVMNIKLENVKQFIAEKCEYCKMKRRNKKLKNRIPPVTSPIVSRYFGQRAQIDLIDFRIHNFPNCAFILNYQDNLTRFCILKPLPNKEADTIINCLGEIFCIFGAPTILHSDNGGEFRNKKLKEYIERFWPALQFIHGKPYTPRSQGAVERANKDVKEMLLSIIVENDKVDIVAVLNFVQFLKNISHHRTIGRCPYNAVFGQDPVVELKAEHLTRSFYNKEVEEEEEEEMEGGREDELTSRKENVTANRQEVCQKTIAAAQKMLKNNFKTDENVK